MWRLKNSLVRIVNFRKDNDLFIYLGKDRGN